MRLGAAAILLAAALAAPACAQTEPGPTVKLSKDAPVATVRVPPGPPPKALMLKIVPLGADGASIEAWVEAPGLPATRLGAVATYPPERPGDFVIGWPKRIGAPPPPAQVRLVLSPPQGGATVTVSWRR